MAKELALRIAELGWEKKANDVVVLDVSTLTQFTDYFVLMTGEVDQHLRAICAHVEDTLKAEGTRPHHVEGRMNLQWLLLDYVDVVVHLFLPPVREFYDLEAFWGEAKSVPLKFIKEEQEVLRPPKRPSRLTATDR